MSLATDNNVNISNHNRQLTDRRAATTAP